VQVGASAGSASAPAGGRAQALLEAADRAMYARKRERRAAGGGASPGGQVAVPVRKPGGSDARMARSIATAVAQGRTSLVYQPVVDLATGRPVGAEVLLRMTDVDGAPVMPDQFLPVAESHGLMAGLGQWVLAESFAQAAAWKAALPATSDFGLGVNVSPLQLHDARVVGHVEAALRATGLPPDAVVLEVTESRLLPDTASVRSVLHALRDLGVHLAIDDFGTGYASVNYLAAFPFDTLKVDRRYTRALALGGDDARLARGVYALATATGIVTIAEGVETSEERRAVAATGCLLGQGYLWSRPVAPEDFVALLAPVPGPPEQRSCAPLAAGSAPH
jgi:EAL domain-containing protein (putative c-di-GMP-specific phosphodiesterase class I)